MSNQDVRFGIFNVETGESQDGYIDSDGQMRFKPLKWWQKLFSSPPEKKEFIRQHQFDLVNCFTGRRKTVTGSLYKTYKPYTGKVYSVWAEYDAWTLNFNPEAFEKGFLIVK